MIALVDVVLEVALIGFTYLRTPHLPSLKLANTNLYEPVVGSLGT